MLHHPYTCKNMLLWLNVAILSLFTASITYQHKWRSGKKSSEWLSYQSLAFDDIPKITVQSCSKLHFWWIVVAPETMYVIKKVAVWSFIFLPSSPFLPGFSIIHMQNRKELLTKAPVLNYCTASDQTSLVILTLVVTYTRHFNEML